ncbi:MAG: four helix bundle protein [Candidatus Sungbacteria bacterium]|nr:four helix bundle protein [Candidatus Sungbacteria bacterium]
MVRQFNIRDRSYQFALDCIQLTKSFPKKTESFVIANQLIRSATSIAVNLSEGQGSVSRREFSQYAATAKKSAIETLLWLKFCRDLNLSQPSQINDLLEECEELVRIISATVLKVKK